MSEYRFSVIVPVYNVEAYLDRCVRSLVCQEGAEILLVDDGSEDHSGELCDQYEREYGNVRTFHKQNGGLSSARNHGIGQARGEYVLFVDSDDYVEADMCGRLWKELRRRKHVDLISFNGVEDDGRTRSELIRLKRTGVFCRSGHDFLLEGYRHRNFNVQAWLYAYRRDFLYENRLRFQEGILHEDVEFLPRAALLAGWVLAVPDCFYHYMVRSGSISTKKNQEKNIKDLFRTLEGQCRLAERQEPELRKWMKDAALDSYLNMIQEARMYQPRYRRLVDKNFLRGKAATNWNRFRALLCRVDVRLYCRVNDGYKRMRKQYGG